MSKKDKFIRVKLIANPGAGNRADAKKNLKLVTSYLEDLGLKADVSQAKPKGKVTPLTRRAIKDGYRIVIALGGDGTVEAVMRGMVGSKARLGIIPVGVENYIAKSLGIPANMQEACALIASNNTFKLDVGQVTTSKGKKFPFFEMVGIGLSEAMYPDMTRAVEKKLPDIPATTVVTSSSDTKARVFLNLDDERMVKAETMLVMVSNTAVFGNKFKIIPNASLKDGFLDITVFQNFSQEDMHGYYASMLDGGYSGSGTLKRFQARKLKVKSFPKLKAMADGIDLGKGTVTIKMISGAVRVIAKGKSPLPANATEDAVETLPATASIAETKPADKNKKIIPLQ